MTVIQPAARFIRNPAHVEGLPDFDGMCELQGLRARFEGVVFLAVPLSIEREVSAVQMHRMTEIRRVDHAPVDLLSDLVVEALCEWPGLTVDGRPRRTVPALQHEYSVVGWSSRRIDHESAAQQRIDNPVVASPAVGCASPI